MAAGSPCRCSTTTRRPRFSEATVPSQPAGLEQGRDYDADAVLPGRCEQRRRQLYVKINGTKVVYNSGAASTAFGVWKQWNIDLAASPASTSRRHDPDHWRGRRSQAAATASSTWMISCCTQPRRRCCLRSIRVPTAWPRCTRWRATLRTAPAMHYGTLRRPRVRERARRLRQGPGFDGTQRLRRSAGRPAGQRPEQHHACTWVNFNNRRQLAADLRLRTGTRTYMFLTPGTAHEQSRRFAIRTTAISRAGG